MDNLATLSKIWPRPSWRSNAMQLVPTHGIAATRCSGRIPDRECRSTCSKQGPVALVRGDLEQARDFAERLTIEVGFASSIAAESSEGTTYSFDDHEKAKRYLTLHRIWMQSADPRVDNALRQARRALTRIADTITDSTFRHRYLNNLAKHREIMALWAAQIEER